MKREFLTPSNLLSLLRALLALPFVLVMFSGLPSARLWGTAILVLGALTDKLDGMVARARHEETEWGRVLDPLADKIGVAAIVLVLLALGDLPLWFVVAILARDLLILAGGLVVKARKGVVLPSNMVGKWSVGAISAILALRVPGFTGAGIDIAFTVLLIVTSAMLLWSLALYTRRFVEVFSSHGHS